MAPCLCVCVCVRLWVHVCAERFLGGREICEILGTEIRSGVTLLEKHTPIHTSVDGCVFLRNTHPSTPHMHTNKQPPLHTYMYMQYIFIHITTLLIL